MRRIWPILRLLVGLGLFGLAILYLHRNQEIEILGKPDWAALGALLGVSVLLIGLRGAQMWYALKGMVPDLGISESLHVAVIASLLNTLLPLQAGLGKNAFFVVMRSTPIRYRDDISHCREFVNLIK